MNVAWNWKCLELICSHKKYEFFSLAFSGIGKEKFEGKLRKTFITQTLNIAIKLQSLFSSKTEGTCCSWKRGVIVLKIYFWEIKFEMLKFLFFKIAYLPTHIYLWCHSIIGVKKSFDLKWVEDITPFFQMNDVFDLITLYY